MAYLVKMEGTMTQIRPWLLVKGKERWRQNSSSSKHQSYGQSLHCGFWKHLISELALPLHVLRGVLGEGGIQDQLTSISFTQHLHIQHEFL